MKGDIKNYSVIEGENDWANNLLEAICNEVFGKRYYIPAKDGKRKRMIHKKLNIKKIKRKFANNSQ